jgi:RNA polymerase sigma factor (sigma-70 family)
MDDPERRLTALYDAHYRSVFRFALLRVDPDAAKDITSETFLVAWRRISHVPDPALPWLLGVARNLLLRQRDARLRDRTIVERLAALTTVWDTTNGDAAEHVLWRESAAAALSALTDKDVEAMVLTSWHGLPPGEAAKVVGCSKTTFTVRLHRARRRLAAALPTDSPHRPQAAARPQEQT